MSDKNEKITRYRGGEGQTVFPLTFPSLDGSEIRAEVLDAVGHASTLEAGTDYIINRISDGYGELILLGDPLGWNSILTITATTDKEPPDAGQAPPADAVPETEPGGEAAAGADAAGEESPTGVANEEAPAETGSGRIDAYICEADLLRDAALSYYAEAKGWKLAGDAQREKAAMTKARVNFWLYAEKKRDIRERFPAPESDALADASAESHRLAELYYLTASGVYHGVGCACTTAMGEWLGLAEIREKRPKARACGRCRPPALEVGA